MKIKPNIELKELEITIDSDICDAIVVQCITKIIENLKADLKLRKAGKNKLGVFSSDKQEDIEIMTDHIDAMKLVIRYFTPA
jgi:hypothetical protein